MTPDSTTRGVDTTYCNSKSMSTTRGVDTLHVIVSIMTPDSTTRGVDTLHVIVRV